MDTQIQAVSHQQSLRATTLLEVVNGQALLWGARHPAPTWLATDLLSSATVARECRSRAVACAASRSALVAARAASICAFCAARRSRSSRSTASCAWAADSVGASGAREALAASTARTVAEE